MTPYPLMFMMILMMLLLYYEMRCTKVKLQRATSGCADCKSTSASCRAHHADGGFPWHRLLKLRPAALMCARAMMTERQKLSKNKTKKHSVVYFIHLCRVVRYDCPITAESPASAYGCLGEATIQLSVLVGSLVSVTSSSSGVDESGFELQRSICPAPPPPPP